MLIEIDKKSWHYTLAQMGDHDIDFRKEWDICGYARSVFLGMFIATLMIALLSSTLIIPTIMTVWWLISMVLADHWLEPNAGVFMIAILIVGVALAAVIVGIHNWIVNYRPNPKPSFVGSVYHKIKTKTCWTVTFK